VFFTIVAVVVSNVAARARMQAVAAMGRARMTESLYAFSRKLAGVATLDDALWATTYQIALMLKVRVVVLLPEHGTLAVKSGYPPEDTIGDADVAAAKCAPAAARSGSSGLTATSRDRC
jgi:two-component system sensor histidine kinase KdpD